MKMSHLESAIRITLQFYKALNRHDTAAMGRLMSDDCLFESSKPAPDGRTYSGKEAITAYWQEFFRDSPQTHIEIEEVFGLGKRCVARWKYTWTDEAGETRHLRGVDILREKNGFIIEILSYTKGQPGLT